MNINELLLHACARRASLHRSLEVYRLFDGIGDGLENFFIDRYQDSLVGHFLPATPEEERRGTSALLDALKVSRPMLKQEVGIQRVYLRVHGKDARTQISRPATLVWGEPCDEALVKDGALSFVVRPAGSLHAGLFVDMREVREKLTKGCTGKRVLNLFCFTGSLGIAAAHGGADEVGQVDSSPAVLTWAKQNWERNPVSHQCTMKFFCDDCNEFLDREVKRVERGGRRTDIALVDPPSFGRGRKRIFSFKKDIGALVSKVLTILAPDGVLYLSTNSRSLSPRELERVVRTEAEKVRWSIADLTPLYPPEIDFPSRGEDSIAMRGVVVRGDNSKTEVT